MLLFISKYILYVNMMFSKQENIVFNIVYSIFSNLYRAFSAPFRISVVATTIQEFSKLSPTSQSRQLPQSACFLLLPSWCFTGSSSVSILWLSAKADVFYCIKPTTHSWIFFGNHIFSILIIDNKYETYIWYIHISRHNNSAVYSTAKFSIAYN